MKKVLVILTTLVMVLFLTSCLNYKAYDVPTEDNENDDDLDLIDEIAEIERQLEENDLVDDEGTDGLDDLELDEEETDSIEEIVSEDDEELEADLEEEITVDMDEESSVDDGVLVFEVNENELIELGVRIVDPDGDDVTYSFSSPLTKEGSWQTNYGDAGEYYVTLTASDEIHTTTQEILIIVNRVNVAPVIKAVKDQTFDEGDIIEFEPEVSDPNGDAVTVEISAPLSAGLFNTDHTSAGVYEIMVTASDGELETETSFMLTITDVNELPVVSGLKDIVVDEGETVVIEPTVTDLDGDDLEITISAPVGNDGVWETGYTDHGEYEITITVDDGKDTVFEIVTVTVEDVNMPPIIENVDAEVN
ncbi:MAG: hypothetical protein ABIG93_03260 [archaeon]|nr:hypothetical protein [Nanoarchaeota archaeon]